MWGFRGESVAVSVIRRGRRPEQSTEFGEEMVTGLIRIVLMDVVCSSCSSRSIRKVTARARTRSTLRTIEALQLAEVELTKFSARLVDIDGLHVASSVGPSSTTSALID